MTNKLVFLNQPTMYYFINVCRLNSDKNYTIAENNVRKIYKACQLLFCWYMVTIAWLICLFAKLSHSWPQSTGTNKTMIQLEFWNLKGKWVHIVCVVKPGFVFSFCLEACKLLTILIQNGNFLCKRCSNMRSIQEYECYQLWLGKVFWKKV